VLTGNVSTLNEAHWPCFCIAVLPFPAMGVCWVVALTAKMEIPAKITGRERAGGKTCVPVEHLQNGGILTATKPTCMVARN
jgi:hypothetical protein